MRFAVFRPPLNPRVPEAERGGADGVHVDFT
jgi:hypothetical protein